MKFFSSHFPPSVVRLYFMLWDAATKYQTEVICLIGAELSSTGVMYVVTDGEGILEVSPCVVTNIYKATPHSEALLCQ